MLGEFFSKKQVSEDSEKKICKGLKISAKKMYKFSVCIHYPELLKGYEIQHNIDRRTKDVKIKMAKSEFSCIERNTDELFSHIVLFLGYLVQFW